MSAPHSRRDDAAWNRAAMAELDAELEARLADLDAEHDAWLDATCSGDSLDDAAAINAAAARAPMPKGHQGLLFGGSEPPAPSRREDPWAGREWAVAPRCKPVQTSASHPLRVDFLPGEAHARPGRLGLTMAPGKCRYGGSADYQRDLDADLATLRARGIDTLVCLLEEHEFATLRIPGFIVRAEAAGFVVRWFPIRDIDVPSDAHAFLDLVNVVIDDLEAGRSIAAHCAAGLGRTGTLVASVLVALGWTPAAAIAQTRATRPGAVQTERQEAWVAEIDARLA